MGDLYDILFNNSNFINLADLYNGLIRYNSRDAYDLDKNSLVFKDIKGQYLPKYTINGLDIYVVPGQDLTDYLEDSGLWSNQDFNKDTNYYMVKNLDDETFSLIPANGNISNLIDYYLNSPTSLHKFGILDNIQNNINTRERINYYSNNPIYGYIGGTPDEARDKFWKRDAVLRYLTDSIANEYDLNPHAYRYRLSHEGITDAAISGINGQNYTRSDGVVVPTGSMPKETFHGYGLLNTNLLRGQHLFGLDQVGKWIDDGDITLKGERHATNKRMLDGHNAPHAEGFTIADDLGITAAALKHCRDQVLEDFPGISNHDADRYAQIYYQRGRSGGKKYIKNGLIPDRFTPKDNYNFK